MKDKRIGIFFLWAKVWQKGRCVSITILIQDVVWFHQPAFIGKGALVKKIETHRLSTSITINFGVFSEIGTQIQCMPKACHSDIIGASSRWVEAGNRSHHRLAPGYAQHLAQAGHDTWFPKGQDASKSFR